MENGFVGRLCLAIGLRVGNGSELGLAPHATEVVSELSGVELFAVVENDGMRNAEASDNVPPYKPSYFGRSYEGDNLDLYRLGEVVNHHKEIFALPRCIGERAKDIHTPSSEWQRTDDWRHGGGGCLLNGDKLLALVASTRVMAPSHELA